VFGKCLLEARSTKPDFEVDLGNTKERIVEAAAQLFSRQGYKGTSTHEVALLANIAEPSLFHHFPSKPDLFWAALQSRLDRLQPGDALQKGLADGGEPRMIIPLVVEFLVDIATSHRELIWLFIVGFLELRTGTERAYQRHLAPMFQAVSDYLSRSIKDGSVREVDPCLATIAFTATVLAHHGLRPLLQNTRSAYSSTNEAIAVYSHFCLSTLAVSKPGVAFEQNVHCGQSGLASYALRNDGTPVGKECVSEIVTALEEDKSAGMPFKRHALASR
jgi:AcrR family transcriptional regulator